MEDVLEMSDEKNEYFGFSDIAVHKKTSCSSSLSAGCQSDTVVDGRDYHLKECASGDYYHSNAGQIQWLQVDLGGLHSIQCIKLVNHVRWKIPGRGFSEYLFVGGEEHFNETASNIDWSFSIPSCKDEGGIALVMPPTGTVARFVGVKGTVLDFKSPELSFGGFLYFRQLSVYGDVRSRVAAIVLRASRALYILTFAIGIFLPKEITLYLLSFIHVHRLLSQDQLHKIVDFGTNRTTLVANISKAIFLEQVGC